MKINVVNNSSQVTFGKLTKEAATYLHTDNYILDSVNKDSYERLQRDPFVEMDYDNKKNQLILKEVPSPLREYLSPEEKQLEAKGWFKFAPLGKSLQKGLKVYEVLADNSKRLELEAVKGLDEFKLYADSLKEQINGISKLYTTREKFELKSEYNKAVSRLFPPPIKERPDTFNLID